MKELAITTGQSRNCDITFLEETNKLPERIQKLLP